MDKNIRTQLGEQLKALRLKNKMSQKDLGEKLGRSQPHVFALENGKTGDFALFNEAFNVFGYMIDMKVKKI